MQSKIYNVCPLSFDCAFTLLRNYLYASFVFVLDMPSVQPFSVFFSHLIHLTDFSPLFRVHHWYTITETIFAYRMKRSSPSLLPFFYVLIFCKISISITMTANMFGVDSLSSSLTVFRCVVLCLDRSSTQICLPAK